MYYALAIIGGVALGMIINAVLISGAREDEQKQHLIELQKEYERGYRQAVYECEINNLGGRIVNVKA